MDEHVDTAIDRESTTKNYGKAEVIFARRYLVEILIWDALALLISAKAIQRFIANVWAEVPFLQSIRLLVKYNSAILLFSAIVILFPILFVKIFGDSPFLLLRRRFLAPNRLRQSDVSGGLSEAAPGHDRNGPRPSAEAAKRLRARDLLASCAERTSELCKRAYARAGVHMLAAVIVSLVGLIFFYSGSRDLPASTDYMDHVFGLLPGLATLLVIELIAVLFLRQYRAAMSDFKHLDEVRRYQEEKLVTLNILAENPSAISLKNALAALDVQLHEKEPDNAHAKMILEP